MPVFRISSEPRQLSLKNFRLKRKVGLLGPIRIPVWELK